MDGIIRKQLEVLDKALYSRFLVIEDKAKPLLEFSQGGSHVFFTPHGYSHISIVELNYDWLLSLDDIQSFTKTELFCLLVATYFHDAFMVPKRPGDEMRARAEHATHAAQFLFSHADILTINIHEAKCIGEVIKGHHVQSLDEIASETVLGYDLVDQRKLAACLSMSDICHADASRAPRIVSDYLELDSESRRHWRRHMQIGGIARKLNKILVNATVFSEDGEKAVKAYCDDIRRQLHLVRPYFDTQLLAISDVSLLLNKMDSPVERPLEFKADMPKLLDLLINSVYSDRNVFLRELIQNSIDACRIREATLNGCTYDAEIICTALYKDKSLAPWGLRIDDNGAGMSINDLEDTVLWLGRSISSSEEIAKLLDGGRIERLIGVFGIGLMSCFGVSKQITISSSKEGSQPFEVKIGKISDRILPYQTDDDTLGTSIVIEFMDDFKFSARSIVDRYFWNIASPIIRVGDDVCEPEDLLSRGECFDSYAHFAKLDKNISLVPTGGTEFFFESAFAAGTLVLWHDSQDPIAAEYVGDVTLLCGGIFVCEIKSDRIFGAALAFLSGAVDLNIGGIDLSASRESFVRNRKFEDVKHQILSLTGKVISKLVIDCNTAQQPDFFRYLLCELFERLEPDEKNIFFAAAGDYVVKQRNSKKSVKLRDCLERDVVYLYQPLGEYVRDAFSFNGERYYKEKIDDQELARYSLEAKGLAVIEARLLKGKYRRQYKDDGIVIGYLKHNKIKVVDISKQNVDEAEADPFPIPAKVSKALGPDVFFVDYGSAMAETSLFSDGLLYLNVNADVVKQLVSAIERCEDIKTIQGFVNIFRLIHSREYGAIDERIIEYIRLLKQRIN